ncbi:MAG TPA: hypothetical protein VIL41_03935 [Coriobacteriia bacterium]
MATKSDFTAEQWQALVFAMEDTMMLVSISNGAKFFESMVEIGATAKFMAEQSRGSRSTLVRDLASGAGMRRDRDLTRDPANLEMAGLSRIAEAVAVVTDVAADELDAFKEFILGVADAAAEARNGVDDQESNAIDKIKSALL